MSLRAIRRVESELGVKFSDELVEYYQWRNGTDYEEAIKRRVAYRFAEGFRLLDMDDSLKAMEAVREGQLYLGDPQFARSVYFPFMADEMGNFVVVNLTPGSARFGRVGLLIHDSPLESLDEYSSFSVYLSALLKCCDSGVYTLDVDGELDGDIKLEESILETFRSKPPKHK